MNNQKKQKRCPLKHLKDSRFNKKQDKLVTVFQKAEFKAES